MLRADFPTENGKTLADAEKACADAFARSSTLQTCKETIGIDHSAQMAMCIEDFKVSFFFRRKRVNLALSTSRGLSALVNH